MKERRNTGWRESEGEEKHWIERKKRRGETLDREKEKERRNTGRFLSPSQVWPRFRVEVAWVTTDGEACQTCRPAVHQ